MMLLLLCSLMLTCVGAFQLTRQTRRSFTLRDFPDDIVEFAKSRSKIYQESQQSGASFKQAVADTMAGPDVDFAAIDAKIDKNLGENPLLVYAWTMSPASKKAISLLEGIGCKMKVINLDKPWDEGNQIRAQLGKKVGRPSVPCIFVNGKYIGGCDDGPSTEAPGLVPLAFSGLLRPMLIQSGALAKDPKVDGDVVLPAFPAVTKAAVDIDYDSSLEKRMEVGNIVKSGEGAVLGENPVVEDECYVGKDGELGDDCVDFDPVK